jgi:hypothetical protein
MPFPPTGTYIQTGPVLLSCPSFLQKSILLVYVSYTGGFIMIFAYILILYPKLIKFSLTEAFYKLKRTI